MTVTKPKYKDVFTGETFKYSEPVNNKEDYIIKLPHLKLWRRELKAYLELGNELHLIDMGSFNELVEAISTMNPDEAIDHVKWSFVMGNVKIIKKIEWYDYPA